MEHHTTSWAASGGATVADLDVQSLRKWQCARGERAEPPRPDAPPVPPRPSKQGHAEHTVVSVVSDSTSALPGRAEVLQFLAVSDAVRLQLNMADLLQVPPT
jgi:hypothetical protein